MSYRKLRHYILKNLSTDLSEGLKYHGMHHTLDVVRVCNQHIARFKLNKKDAELLRIGALMHDYGFLFTYKNHEEKGIEKAKEILPLYGYSAQDIKIVCGLILATKVPQKPQTDLEQIEALEQVRVLYQGEKIHVAVANSLLPVEGVDTEQDLIKARAYAATLRG